jgi:hypothetical protein
LSPAELDVVRGLVFERRAAPPDPDPDKAAPYNLDGYRGTISAERKNRGTFRRTNTRRLQPTTPSRSRSTTRGPPGPVRLHL